MDENTYIGGVKSETGLVLISVLAMEQRPGTAGRIMGAMASLGFNVEFIAGVVGFAGRDNVVFCVTADQAEAAVTALNAMQAELDVHTVSRRDEVGLIFTFGPEFRETPAIAAQIFDLLGSHNINILAISTSIAAVTCVVKEQDVAQAEAVLQEVFVTP